MIKEIISSSEKAAIIKSILTELPEWFGIEAYVNEYVKKSKNMPVFVAYDNDNPIGFIALKTTSEHTAEIYCMGVYKAYHNKGYGKRLYQFFEKYALNQGYTLIQVKTVQEGKYIEYDQTIKFYKSLGFYELEVLPKLWDEHNPCQIFVKPLIR